MKTTLPEKEFYAADRKAWRNWLKKNHATEKNVWLVFYKKDSGVLSISVSEAVEEALCFGWIDGRAHKRDDESYRLLYSERKPKSTWSKINKQRIIVLIKSGQMTEAGLEKIKIAKANGSWETLDAIEEHKMPAPLEAAFKKNKKARQYFDAFPPSARKLIYYWIISAKTQATLDKRVKETVEKAQLNIRANQPTPRK